MLCARRRWPPRRTLPARAAEQAAPAPAGAELPAERQKADQQTELRGVEDTIRASEEQRRAIQAEIDSIGADQARLMEAMIATTARVQEAERGVASADTRLAGLESRAATLAGSLQSRRAAIAEILAAIQRMGANPPPAILVRSGDMAEAVRAATLLTAMTANLKDETGRIAHDIDDLVLDPRGHRRRTRHARQGGRVADDGEDPARGAGRGAQGVPVVGGGGARLAAEAARPISPTRPRRSRI